MKPNHFGNFLYNLDRALASLIWGTSQETISSEVGRIARGETQVGQPLRWVAEAWVAKRLAGWLDSTPRIWGVDHTTRAIAHANALEVADDGKEE